MSGDCCGKGVILPLCIGTSNQESCRTEADKNHKTPGSFGSLGPCGGDVGEAVDGGGLQELPQDVHCTLAERAY